jgi:3-oxoacyl-[acyl-carrier-protein] synthase II
MSAFISGTGWVTVQGAGMGRNADPFELSEGSLPKITGKITANNQVFHRFGRMDQYSKLGMKAITYALQDAGLDAWKEKRDIGVVVSTVFGCLTTDIDYYDTVMTKSGILADPNLFAYTLPNSFLGYASMIFGLTGTNFIIHDKTGSGLSALRSALDCIVLGECRAMLAGICDVESPADFPIAGNPAPGSVFVVIEKDPERQSRSYGNLSVDNSGKVFFNESEIKDISACVKRCLSDKTGI